ncbi:Uncharacterised protein [[Clostridium] sordellii]|uniref:hypothetical protein n=1 Tax=Paraclostridium sordellii TaxID=1505 RepID=UPI0005E17A8A|nr:hypothetical protein [Paeniclostridium sordellii]CEQ01705.1 Uncharacterised protein [[Clostridium] sordellii] [Paeniclostridium sordellii]
MNKEIMIVDAICGAGKTTFAIQKMKEDDKLYIYVTPYLSEIERIITATDGDFKQPNNKNEKGSKLESLKWLVTRGENIVCTHELFKLCDLEMLNLIKDMGYNLILDEVLNVINPVKISKKDIHMLEVSKTIHIDKEKGIIKWLDDEYKGKFEELKHLSKNDNLFLFRDTFVFWTLHHKAFECFKDVYILTYLFDGSIQRYYYDLHGFKYKKYSVIKDNDRYRLIDYDSKLDNRERLKELINIYEDKGRSKLNSNYCKKPTDNMFSSTWLSKCDNKTLEVINQNLFNFFKTTNTPVSKLYWTTIKDFKTKFINKKTKNKNFISVNVRATNDYMNCTSCAFIYNRYMNPIERAFFEYHNVEVDEDTLACGDLIQYIFRSCIRIGKPINVYIPSQRMRKLLYKYLNYEI